MEQKKDICPHCGATKTIVGKQSGHGGITPESAWTILNAQPLYHVVCRSCGTVIRSYVKDPQELDY